MVTLVRLMYEAESLRVLFEGCLPLMNPSVQAVRALLIVTISVLIKEICL